MGGAAPSAGTWTRRKTVALALLAVGLPLGWSLTSAGADPSSILVVSRKRLLNDTDHARALLEAEIALTSELQSQVDRVKQELAAEEAELARLRYTAERGIFEARVAEFDRRVRRERRTAQRRAVALQSAFRSERRKLLEAIDPLLAEVLRSHGASIIVDRDQTLASDPALDITDEVIARFNATVPQPTIPDFESIRAVLESATAPR